MFRVVWEYGKPSEFERGNYEDNFYTKVAMVTLFPFCERIFLRVCVRESDELRISEKIRNFRLVISFLFLLRL